MARHVRKGDSVVVTAGNDRGKVGEILRVIPAEDRIIVQGVNIRVRHLKPTQQNPKGGLLRKEMPIHISNVSPVVDGRGTRVRFEKREDGSKVRLAVRGGKELSVLRGPKQG
jgi:large subunit ribosomal protein L24|tara:strand:+ start:249 stop:584 length:336 start_codon:yes stop_codon:yes gene_type:complete